MPTLEALVTDSVSRINNQLPQIVNDLGLYGLLSSLEIIVARQENGRSSVRIADFRRLRSLQNQPWGPQLQSWFTNQLQGYNSFSAFPNSAMTEFRHGVTTELQSILNQDQSRYISFAGVAQFVEEHLLIPVISFNSEQMSGVPCVDDVVEGHRNRLPGQRHDQTSLAHELGFALVQKVSDFLPQLNNGAIHVRGIPEALFREAARELMKQPGHHLVYDGINRQFARSLFTEIAAVSRLTYEGDSTNGCIVFKNTSTFNYSEAVRFDPPIPMSQPKQFRKVLETANKELTLVADEATVYGSVSFSELPSAVNGEHGYPIPEDHYAIIFQGGHTWDLCYGEKRLMTVTQDNARLPIRSLEKDQFLQSVTSVFSDANPDALWNIVDLAIQQPHGTMIVISNDASDEAERLKEESTVIRPQALREEYILGLTSIDGSLLIDETGTCHAIGVILDGRSEKGKGDSSRGARHNAAIRYYETEKGRKRSDGSDVKCMIVTVSEDGGVSILSSL